MAGTGQTHLRETDALLSVRDLVVEYRTSRGTAQAVSGISFDVMPNTTLGIVGESGCGKSTIARSVARLTNITSGEIEYRGERIDDVGTRRMRELRCEIQMIFQDPIASLNPRREVKDLVVEGLVIAGRSTDEVQNAAAEVLAKVGLGDERFTEATPKQLSGGQAQRVAIGRALALEPQLLICDEPVSALDVSVQAQIINLLEQLKQEYGLTIVFIAHDLSVVRVISDDVMVMYLGKMCEYGDAAAIYSTPAHPYTRALLDSVPAAESGFTGPALEGDLPSPLDPPTGCRFRTRCPRAQELCTSSEPEMRSVGDDHFVACHFPLIDPS